MKKWLVLILLIIVVRVCAQDASFATSSENAGTFNEAFRRDSVLSFRSGKGFFPSLLHNLGYQATFPLRMRRNDLLLLAGGVAITAGLINVDENIDEVFKPIKKNNPFISNVSPFVTELGDVYGYALLAGYGGYSIIFHKYRAFRTSLLATQAGITAGLWIRVGKIFTGRMRPGETYGDPEYNSDHWFGPFAFLNNKYNTNRGVGGFDAFPSGHTGAAFAMATVFSQQYKDYKAMPYVMYSLAGIVAVTRMIEHEHWASDVFVGGIIGYLCGRQVVAHEKKLFPGYKTPARKTSSSFFPVRRNGINGVAWTMVF